MEEQTDRFGRTWQLDTSELCRECGQPDNCGDCDHERLTDDDVLTLGGRLRRSDDRLLCG